ncbi:hypothetical protein A3H80_02940 [Candidatus Roizmanbacteria bacterium RIFCSPLOWO2_02_FULL_37_19]|uniref:Uncharacterized protein n=1 Tax=Candidatus Roizmanbacteria bacterium RIFCSPHIGHO2_02_FULL_37_24 TaxID=1802037 RepID=A0A1F7GYZ5_9BACT|nr:MAG: hypothetical protein A2862_03755 [Candidatus Roizmanbacteria bacterium RIFCSPHIGHO2_01_FULL_38_41]OGK24279.1 MAG: hypothetical protein A3C24_04235 [Candidatus Roizmanbacteria bacterium RIFCSPHIGHO2_02_FULL_37_24]OGK32165.1 MAG: hypothetical protein A3E10_03520 [Candidatus Roizmanbacteria bacterium RIFCSPHIGHO2_12_FULL_37_23]OGK43829.1 MAG: hypothetical protein A2956_04895 [Candidatus Roizmanbacteria bacterium RIFCSPLOWO2_01_FULL_37_57]OGK53816.1 MAG: hypothetical protein A3H80_02940 [Ca
MVASKSTGGSSAMESSNVIHKPMKVIWPDLAIGQIGLVFTGGTLSMAPDPKTGALRPAVSGTEIVDATGLRTIRDHFSVETMRQPFNLDSSDLTPPGWVAINNALLEVLGDSDGAAVFHGTDTLAYSASATAMALAHSLSKPVVFTGAQVPLGTAGEDASANITRSVKLLDTLHRQNAAGVYVYFGDLGIIGTRATKVSDVRFQAFEDVSRLSAYFCTAEEIQPARPPRTTMDVERSKAEWANVVGEPLEARFAPNGVLSIELNPGTTADSLVYSAENPSVRILILRSLGAGNVPAQEDNSQYNIPNAIAEITSKLSKPVIIVSPIVGGSIRSIYEGNLKALKAGAISAGSMSAEAAWVKALLLLGQPKLSEGAFNTRPEETMDLFRKTFVLDLAGETGKQFDAFNN